MLVLVVVLVLVIGLESAGEKTKTDYEDEDDNEDEHWELGSWSFSGAWFLELEASKYVVRVCISHIED